MKMLYKASSWQQMGYITYTVGQLLKTPDPLVITTGVSNHFFEVENIPSWYQYHFIGDDEIGVTLPTKTCLLVNIHEYSIFDAKDNEHSKIFFQVLIEKDLMWISEDIISQFKIVI